MERNAIGIELNPKYVALAEQCLAQEPESPLTRQIMYCDNALNAIKYIDEEIKLIFTPPPYGTLLQKKRKNTSCLDPKRNIYLCDRILAYSQNDEDLGNMDDDSFLSTLLEVFRRLKPYVRGHVIIDMLDPWVRQSRRPHHVQIINGMIDLGYKYRNMIIWNKRKLFNHSAVFGYPYRFITFGETFNYLMHYET